MSGGGSKSPSKQTTVTEPFKEQKPYLLEVFKEAQNLYGGQPPQYFPGETVAGFTPAQEASQQYLLGPGQQVGAAYGNLGLQGLAQNINRSPTDDPYLDAIIDAATRPLFEQFSEAGGVLSQIRSGAGQAGQYGSTRQGIAEGIANRNLQNAVGDVTAEIGSDAYNRAINAQIQSLSLLPQLQQASFYPALLAEAVGSQQQAQDQAYINSLIQRHNFEQNIPASQLAQYQNFINGNFGGTSTTTGVPARGGTNPLLSGLGGAASGAAITGGNPIGAAIGGAIGLLGGL